MSLVVTPDEFLEWKAHPITRAFFQAIRNKREVFKEDLINGLYENVEFVQGKADVIALLLEMKYEDLMELLHDK